MYGVDETYLCFIILLLLSLQKLLILLQPPKLLPLILQPQSIKHPQKHYNHIKPCTFPYPPYRLQRVVNQLQTRNTTLQDSTDLLLLHASFPLSSQVEGSLRCHKMSPFCGWWGKDFVCNVSLMWMVGGGINKNENLQNVIQRIWLRN